MTALTDNFDRELRDADVALMPVAAGANVRQGGILRVAAGHVSPVTGTGQVVAGVALQPADNTGGAAGAVSVAVRLGGAARVAATVGNAPAVGALAYAADDNTVDSRPGEGSVMGRVVQIESDGDRWVMLATFQDTD